MLINHGGHRVLDKLTKENVGKFLKKPTFIETTSNFLEDVDT
jgi:hypothetical protein